ncbi:ras-associated and pleckstrin-likey domains-containing protein 1 isoform X4 [Silurus asotus]|uniref:Ras-associated and pleckstrin-likey domains-containing protein 1 isoform X4 n=1 Tax=Silurus asotus TaxID=30991 RepID=A0AAD5AMD8_SILAS|nr:ras-associated and pleckstrin-likey domains-containing protein 1 isoform X4 [Silurus asotus]
MEQVSDDELDHAAEEDSDKEDQDLDKMFGAWLGELDKLTQSLDDGRHPGKVQKAPLREETNLANFSYRFSMYNINEAINQGEPVDLDALMADLCSIEQELSTIGKPSSSSSSSSSSFSSSSSSSGRPADPKSRQRAAHARSASARQAGGSSGGSACSSSHASPAGTVRVGGGQSRPMVSNFSLDDITAQLEQASRSMDEAARQTSESSMSNSLRRAGSVGGTSDQEVRSVSRSSHSSVNSVSASSMDSLDIRGQEGEAQNQANTEGAAF